MSWRNSWKDVHCEIPHNWVCQIRAGQIPNPPPGPVAPDYNRTINGWLLWNGAQYFIDTHSIAMEEARCSCQRRHSDLVVINSEAESVFLWKRVSRDYGYFWIGLNVDLDKTYSWMDGSPVVFQRWDENQPYFQRNDENCAAMTQSTGFWHVFNCGQEHKFICKRSSSPTANTSVAPTVVPKGGCPQNWKQFDSKCYIIINNQNETWHGARTQCKAMGGNLASILSRKVQVFLTAKMVEAPAIKLWIGLNSVHGNPLLWTDGRPVRYLDWATNNQMNYDFYFGLHYLDNACVVMTPNPIFGIGKWMKSSCNDTNGYVCLRNVDISLPESPEPTTTDYVKIFNDSFKLVSEQMNWYAAKMHCESDGASLASLRNPWSQAYVELLGLNVKGPMWIGINKNETAGYFKYIDGWHITKTNWDIMEPKLNLPCVSVDVEGKWKTADCKQKMNSICMKTTDVPPTESSAFPGFCPDDLVQTTYSSHIYSWQSFRGYCYLFVKERVAWPDASFNCVRYGGLLASIEDPSEQVFIQNNIKLFQDSQSSFWIGLYKTHADIWQWLDKTAMDYINWHDSDVSYSSYGSITTEDGKWTSGNQWYDRGYICKTPKILRKAQQTTVQPMVDPQGRGRNILVVVLVITMIAIGTTIGLFLFKKSGRRLPIPERLSTFDNQLFFNNERSQPDANKLVANAEEENVGPAIAV